MPSYKEKLLAKAQQGIAPREKVAARQGSVLSEPKVIADASTPAKITSNVVDKAIEAPIANAKQQVTSTPVAPAPVATGQVTGQVAPVTPATIPLRETLEQQGINVYWNPESGQVTANGMPVDTSRMNLSNGVYSANQEDINAIMEQVQQGQQQDVQQQGPVGQYQQAAQTGTEQKQDILGKYSEQVAGITEDFQNRQPLYTEDITNSLRQAFGDPFEYDPNKDPALQEAQKYAEREIVNAMNARGVLNSTITRDEYASMLSSMIPKYESIAYDRYQTGINNQLKKVSVLRGLSQDDYNRYKDTVDLTLNNLQNVTDNAINMIDENLDTMYETTIKIPNEEADRKSKEALAIYDRALDKIDMLGYVDNETSEDTGIPAGTLTKDAKKIIGNRIATEEEKRRLLENKTTIDEIAYERTRESMAEAKEITIIKNQAQAAFQTIADEISQMSAEQGLKKLQEMRGELSNYLGEYFEYVSDDINNLRDELVKRNQKEVDQQRLATKDARLAKESREKLAKQDNREEGVSTSGFNSIKKDIADIANKVVEFEQWDASGEVGTGTRKFIGDKSTAKDKRDFLVRIEPYFELLSPSQLEMLETELMVKYDITKDDIDAFDSIDKPITGVGGKPLGVL